MNRNRWLQYPLVGILSVVTALYFVSWGQSANLSSTRKMVIALLSESIAANNRQLPERVTSNGESWRQTTIQYLHQVPGNPISASEPSRVYSIGSKRHELTNYLGVFKENGEWLTTTKPPDLHVTLLIEVPQSDIRWDSTIDLVATQSGVFLDRNGEREPFDVRGLTAISLMKNEPIPKNLSDEQVFQLLSGESVN